MDIFFCIVAKPDFLLCDLSTPGEDGISLLRRVWAREQDGKARLPAIALTTFLGQIHRTESVSAGFDALLSKLIRQKELIDSVLEVIKQPVADQKCRTEPPSLADQC